MNRQTLFGKKPHNYALLLLLVFLSGHSVSSWNASEHEFRFKESKLSVHQLAESAASLPCSGESIYKVLDVFVFAGFIFSQVLSSGSVLKITRFVSPSERNIFYYITTINAP